MHSKADIIMRCNGETTHFREGWGGKKNILPEPKDINIQR